jgi:hypothetical protein
MGALITLALLVDGLQMLLPLFHVIPAIGTAFAFLASFFVGLVGMVFINLAFALCGVNFISGKRALAKLSATLGPAVLELTGLLSWIPSLTLGTIVTFAISRIEDREEREKFRMAQARELEARRRAAAAASQGAATTVVEEEEAAQADEQGMVIDLAEERAKREARQSRLGAPGLPSELPLPDFQATPKQAANARTWR